MENDSELKAGHPPAVKVGGVRIVQHKSKEEKDAPPPKPSSDEVAAYGEDKPVKPPTAVMVSGAKASEESAYPTEAVKSFHEKPLPTHDKGAQTKPKVIHQPKK